MIKKKNDMKFDAYTNFCFISQGDEVLFTIKSRRKIDNTGYIYILSDSQEKFFDVVGESAVVNMKQFVMNDKNRAKIMEKINYFLSFPQPVEKKAY